MKGVAKSICVLIFRGKNEEELNCSSRKKVTFASDLLAEGEEETESGKRRNELWAFLCSNDEEEGKNQAEVLSDEKTKGEKQGNDHEAIDIVSDSSQSSLFTYPPNNRFKNCDDECEDTAMNRINLGNEIVSNCFFYFSLSVTWTYFFRSQ